MEDKDTLEGLRAGGFEDVDEVIRSMEELKEKGNNAFRRGPKYYGNAMRHYKVCSCVIRSACVAWWNDAAGPASVVMGACPFPLQSALKHEHDVESSEELRAVLSTIHSNIGAIFLVRVYKRPRIK